jgi:hypothetical protein
VAMVEPQVLPGPCARIVKAAGECGGHRRTDKGRDDRHG